MYSGETVSWCRKGPGTRQPLQQAELKIGKDVSNPPRGGFWSAMIVTVGILRGEPTPYAKPPADPRPLFALILTVAAISRGRCRRCVGDDGRRGAPARQEASDRREQVGGGSQGLAGVDVLCADKTGTLTQKKATLGDPFSSETVSPPIKLTTMGAASRSRTTTTPSIWPALAGMKDRGCPKGLRRGHFMLFDPVQNASKPRSKRRMEKHQGDEGCAEALKMSADAAQVKAAVDKAVDDFGCVAFVRGVARADGDGRGSPRVLPLIDPPRDDVKRAIATAEEMGVKVKMVTGDALAIAKVPPKS